MGLNSVILVALGGALGAVGRYGVGAVLKGVSSFPLATLSVNLVGSLLMGLLIGWFSRQPAAQDSLRLFLAVGILGGFTTFSAFSMDMVQLLEKRDMLAIFGYVGGSLVGGGILFAAGYLATKAS